MIGELLGDYRVLARIGAGGFGVVFLAEDQRTHEEVALKVLGDRMEPNAGLKRFARELEVLQRIEHPQIVTSKSSLLEEDGRHYFAMELVRGRNLAEVLGELGRLEPGEALRIVSDALGGLEAAHAAGVLHRDLKCANLLLDAEGQVRVCDFGLARAVDHTRQTMSQTLLGTPAYLSPEQARGLDARVESDVYSAGVVLYETLTGTLPFRAETPVALLRLHLEAEPDPPSSRRPGLPPELDALVLRAMHKDPEQRFPTATALRSAIDELRPSLPITQPGELRIVVERANRELARDVSSNRAKRSGSIGIYVGGALILAAFAFGLLRLSEQQALGLGFESEVAPITTQDAADPRAEVELLDGQTFRGAFRRLEGERFRLVDLERQLVLEAPASQIQRLRFVAELAPADAAAATSAAVGSAAR